MNRPPPRFAVIGGGAAGFFGAIASAEASPEAVVSLYEATRYPLAKVRISGGGRCNATHACFDPRELSKRYPRGSRELIGPFHRFGPTQTIAWFAERGVELKTEADGRMFPVTDDSATIVDCLMREAGRAGVRVNLNCAVRAVTRLAEGGFRLELATGLRAEVERLLIATGGARAGGGVEIAASLGHTIEPPVPSLFTFNVADPRLAGLEGLAVPGATASVEGTKLAETGPVLVTHWGVSGPAILRLSAWGARELAARDYRFTLRVSWVGAKSTERALAELVDFRSRNPRKQVSGSNPFGLPSRLWERLVAHAGLGAQAPWTSASNAALQSLATEAAAGRYDVAGKSTNKDEFVTCGGVRLAEVNFQTMESRVCPGLHFAGEVLDIDGITGGFNFQAAWTTSWLAGKAMAGVSES